VTVTLMDVWGDIQNVNDKKGTAFLLAIVAEALGVVGVAVAAALLFF
jgi:cell division protein FtsW (lipid II flippase)